MNVKAMIGLLVALAIGGGDVCVTTSNGTTTRRDIDEQRGQDRQGSYIGIGVGGIFLAVLGARQRRRAMAGH